MGLENAKINEQPVPGGPGNAKTKVLQIFGMVGGESAKKGMWKAGPVLKGNATR